MSIRKAGAIIAGTGSGGGNPDDVTINKNNADKLQAIGTINKNTTGTISQLYNWMGTLAEYTEQNIETLHPEWVCFITDDADGSSQLNNPFSLLDYKYSEYELSNASWLLSNGQWNSGAVYQSVYDLLLQIYNGTVTKAGVSVKLSTETYADTDFVINTADTTFRLPLKVALASGKAVVGNGMTLGLTDGTLNSGFEFVSAAGDSGVGYNHSTSYGVPVGSSAGNTPKISGKTVGVTTDETKSGIETSANGLYLYFYVGETVQDANIIAAGQALTDIADLKAHYIVETYVNGTSWYRLYSDKWCEQGGHYTHNNVEGTVTTTLLKSFIDTNYNLQITKELGSSSAANTHYQFISSYVANSKTTSSFQVRMTAADRLNGYDWQACGYIR